MTAGVQSQQQNNMPMWEAFASNADDMTADTPSPFTLGMASEELQKKLASGHHYVGNNSIVDAIGPTKENEEKRKRERSRRMAQNAVSQMLDETLARIDRQLEEVGKEIKFYENRLQEIEVETTQLQTEKEELQTEKEELQDDLEENKTATEEAEQEVEALKEKAIEHAEEKKDLEHQKKFAVHAHQDKALDEKIKNVEERQALTKEEIAERTGFITSQKFEADQLEKRIEKIDARLEGIEERLGTLESEKTDIENNKLPALREQQEKLLETRQQIVEMKEQHEQKLQDDPAYEERINSGNYTIEDFIKEQSPDKQAFVRQKINELVSDDDAWQDYKNNLQHTPRENPNANKVETAIQELTGENQTVTPQQSPIPVQSPVPPTAASTNVNGFGTSATTANDGYSVKENLSSQPSFSAAVTHETPEAAQQTPVEPTTAPKQELAALGIK